MVLAALLALATCANMSTGEMQRLWQAVAQHAREVAGLVPGRVESQTEVRDGDDKVRGTVREVAILKGWQEGKPAYEVKREESGKPGITVTLQFTGQSTPFFAASEGELRLKKMASEVGEGRCLIRYDFAMTQVAKRNGGPMTFEGIAWLDGATGSPVKVISRPTDLATPIKKWELTLSFPPETGAPPLPRQATLRMEVGTLFWKRTVVLTQYLMEWQPLQEAKE